MDEMQRQGDNSQYPGAHRDSPSQPATLRRALPRPNSGQDAHLEPRAWLFAVILLQRGFEQFINEWISWVIRRGGSRPVARRLWAAGRTAPTASYEFTHEWISLVIMHV
jgi:hypothetical protein